MKPICIAIVLWFSIFSANGNLVVSEVHALVSRAVRFDDNGLPHYGTGTDSWKSPNWDDSGWSDSSPSINTAGVYSAYQRCKFTASATDASSTSNLQLIINWHDGFIAYINGVEVYRANMGNTPMYGWWDAQAFNIRKSTTAETINLGTTKNLIVAGENTFAIQVHGLTYGSLSTPPHPVSDVKVDAQYTLGISGGNTLISSTASCKFFNGIAEPSGSPYDSVPDPVKGDYPQEGWIELWNNATSTLDLSGWSLTDTDFIKKKFVFPASALTANGYIVIMTDERNYTGDYFHTNFKLDDNDILYIYDSTGNLVLEYSIPKQSRWYTSGYNPAGNGTVYFINPTPGKANDFSQTLSDYVDTPSMSLVGGHYKDSVTINITCSKNGATIRYTLDGSEPISTSTVYTDPLTFSTTTVIRAYATYPYMVDSLVQTETYILNAPSEITETPTLVLNGDHDKSIYQPMGIFTIQGGIYSGGLWQQSSDSSYSDFDMCLFRGDFTRRGASFAIYFPASMGLENVKPQDVSIRVSFSQYSRPRARLTYDHAMDDSIYWPPTNPVYKPSINLGYSKDYGDGKLDGRIIPTSPWNRHDNFRLRAGKNDMTQPFIVDEWVRRAYLSMEQPSVTGIIGSLWVNGVLKGYYNMAEKVDAMWLSQVYGVSQDSQWDILKENVAWERGDDTFLVNMVQWMIDNNLNTISNYEKVLNEYIWLDSVIDYLLINSYFAMWDWPLNNLYAIRQRTTGPNGRFRFIIWDAEGGIGLNHNTNYNTFSSDLIASVTTPDPSRLPSQLFSLLYKVPEFQLRWADRVQLHLYNNGSLTATCLQVLWDEVVAEYSPLQSYILGLSMDSSRFNQWILNNGRLPTYLTQMENIGLWQTSVLAPNFSPFGPITIVSGSINVVVSNPNGGSSIYYTTDGSDPRQLGGAVGTTAVHITTTTTITINSPTRLCARVLSSTTWSPVTCSTYSIVNAYSIGVTEIMYNPPGGKKYEFIELKNTGSVDIDMTGIDLKLGNSTLYHFQTGTLFKTGQFVVIASDTPTFEYYYGFNPTGQLNDYIDNKGTTLSLVYTPTSYTILTVTYNDNKPWPRLADGLGFSIVPVVTNPNSRDPIYSNYAGWRASSYFGGSPNADDPDPIAFSSTIKVNELSPYTTTQVDWVELYNPTNEIVDIGYWWLTDDWQEPMKYIILPNTKIQPNGYLVFDSLTLGFAFSSEGEEIWLIASTFAEEPLRYYNGFKYQIATQPDIVYNRYSDCNGVDYISVGSSPTPNTANSPPLYPTLSSVIISNIAATANPLDQYVKIVSLVSTPISLAGWTLSRNYNNPIYVFTTETIPRYGTIIVAATPSNFISSSLVVVVGPLLEPLDPNGQPLIITLHGGGKKEIIVVDEADYETNATGWPTPSNQGIFRIDPLQMGNNICSWSSTPEVIDFTGVVWLDENKDGKPQATETRFSSLSVCAQMDISGDVDLMCEVTDVNGNFTFTSSDFPFISLSHSFTFHLDLSEKSLLNVIPYPFPLSGQVSPSRTDAVVTLTAPLSLENYVYFPIIDSPYIIEGYITDTKGNAFANLPVKITQPTGNVISSTDSNGHYIFDQEAQKLDAGIAVQISVSLSISGTSWHVYSSNWVESGGNAVLSLSALQYGEGIDAFFNLTLSTVPAPPTSPSIPSSPSSPLIPSSPSNPSIPSSPSTPSSPSSTNPGRPGFTPLNNTVIASDSQGLLGIGEDASIGVIVAIVVVVLIIIIVIIVLVVKSASEDSPQTTISMERV